MALTPESRVALQLDWRNPAQGVTVVPADQDRFHLRMRKAIEILKQAQHAEEFQQQITILMQELGSWLKEQEGIKRAFLTIHEGRMLFLVVRADSTYDEDFENCLSELDVRLARDPDLNKIDLNCIALPTGSRDALESFIDRNFLVSYDYGDAEESHTAREQESAHA